MSLVGPLRWVVLPGKASLLAGVGGSKPTAGRSLWPSLAGRWGRPLDGALWSLSARTMALPSSRPGPLQGGGVTDCRCTPLAAGASLLLLLWKLDLNRESLLLGSTGGFPRGWPRLFFWEPEAAAFLLCWLLQRLMAIWTWPNCRCSSLSRVSI